MCKRIFSIVLLLTASAMQLCLAQESEGIFVRLMNIRVDSASIDRWERGVSKIAEAAQIIGDDFCCDWLLYRQGVSRYRVVFFSDGFADLQTPESFAALFSSSDAEELFIEGSALIAASEYMVEGDLVHQMVRSWSTVDEMSTSTHPKGRLTFYWVKPGHESAFDTALSDLVTLLNEIDYPFPVEGFRWRLGSPRINYLAVFSDSWPSFFNGNDPQTFAFQAGRGNEYANIIARVENSTSRSEVHDIDFAFELSF